ncbi:hypothetical protein FKW77_007398 [Venturia effusa]|uniref:Uncharacterized protein n=1 Tax=Venturia effusa TaxID=50376 RepID=A0A517L5R7_9PEZI|nr:hypothetical protein FKW77_007398 [Venturia effusa]
MPIALTPPTPTSCTSDTMAQEHQHDINIPLTHDQLHELDNEQLVMTIMASSVLLQSRLNMTPIDEVDKVLAVYETLVQREGREHASKVGHGPRLDDLMEKIELVAEKEKVEEDLDYVLDFSNGAIYENAGGRGKVGQESGRNLSGEILSEFRSGSQAGTCLSRVYTSQRVGVADGAVDACGAADGSLVQDMEDKDTRSSAQEEQKHVIWADKNVRSG